jgi:hypothetical protein
MADSAKNENQVELGGDELFTTAETIFVDSLASGLSIADSADKAGFSYMTGRRYHKRQSGGEGEVQRGYPGRGPGAQPAFAWCRAGPSRHG